MYLAMALISKVGMTVALCVCVCGYGYSCAVLDLVLIVKCYDLPTRNL